MKILINDENAYSTAFIRLDFHSGDVASFQLIKRIITSTSHQIITYVTFISIGGPSDYKDLTSNESMYILIFECDLPHKKSNATKSSFIVECNLSYAQNLETKSTNFIHVDASYIEDVYLH